MAQDFSTEVNATDEATVIHVRGEIDIATAGRLRDVIEPHMGPHQKIVLDLSEVEFMDSSSLKMLVQARGRLTENGGSLSSATRRRPRTGCSPSRAPTTSSKLTPRIALQIQTDPLPGGRNRGLLG